MNSKEAFLIAAAKSDTGVEGMQPIFNEIREAAEDGRLCAHLRTPVSDLQKCILFQLGYGFCPDGSLHWSGMQNFNGTINSLHADSLNLAKAVSIAKTGMG